MSSDRLREAARVLRERAERVIASDSRPEQAVEHFVSYYGTSRQEGADPLGIDAAYIATMHPSVGLTLADWLDAEADERRWGRLRDFDAVGISDRIADLILGGTP